MQMELDTDDVENYGCKGCGNVREVVTKRYPENNIRAWCDECDDNQFHVLK
jgi:hypothetical protein